MMTEKSLRINVLRICRPPKICLHKLIKVGPWLLSLANAVMSPKPYLPLIMLYYLQDTIKHFTKLPMQMVIITYMVLVIKLIITFPFGLIPLWASKWPLLNKLLITAFLGIFFIAIYTIPRAAFVFCIIYWVVVLLSAGNVNNMLKNSR